MEYAQSFTDLPDAGDATLFGALPCTWGSPWQTMHWHKRGQGAKYMEQMAGLYRQFELLLASFVILGRAVAAKDGFTMLEWPAYSRLLGGTVRYKYDDRNPPNTHDSPWLCHWPKYEGRRSDQEAVGVSYQ